MLGLSNHNYTVMSLLQAIHSCCVTLSSSLAELSSVTAYLHTAQQQATSAASQLQQLQQLLQEQMQEMHARGVGPAIGQNGGSHTRKVAHSTAAGGVSSDHGAASDAVAALQLEVAALRLQLQMREGEVQQLMTREKQLLSGECCYCSLMHCPPSSNAEMPFATLHSTTVSLGFATASQDQQQWLTGA